MTSQAIVVMAPQRANLNNQTTSVFLAGVTTSTREPDWRQALTDALSNHPVVILNPDRRDWDSTWREDFSDKRWAEQVLWELDMQEAADIIVFMFHEATEAPISLMELGLAVRTKSVIVCAHPDYRKRGNVDAVCRKFGVQLLDTLEELVRCLITMLDQRSK
ncbi:hypothetical protein NXS19_002738 [Fusarium pseudograminearum]|uniref:Uncharacterized protein n=1 Tax=Fusarium pseudograminearum (strain CS3096) TaxID=1028729 RepID=K3VWC2_FUSPC|nr:hypothetical protein FPSE_00614 [Fusarium pseudograminearum CS3096]EKJ79303.1 hypothetical protein FPSE_00614 [Fusarium pseudograminearum CS3096]KAF0634761.1 hypothetical protein FPSE5266_00614 [Fusarium pseudograminearum]UZP34922.1 hypothetical protein NXS19_002738 [Fusarium pseudograminearum]